jgi:diadenosine tetraphosphate (Ap4A) HIT family hydrolase
LTAAPVSCFQVMDDCLACELTHGRRPLPGGLIRQDDGWRVEHCVGPLGLGTLIVKPERHVTGVADLTDGEAWALGPLLRRASRVAGRLVSADQVYNCLWSHAGGVPVHIHYVVQPVTKQQMAEFGCHGPDLQIAMFANGVTPEDRAIEGVAAQARILFVDS